MKPKLMEILVCPCCQQDLDLIIHEGTAECIEEGALKCVTCGREYPIQRGIPRMLDETLLSQIDRQTLRSFSYQWRTFKEMYPEWEENFLYYSRPKTSQYFVGKYGLDVGCGFGRHMRYAAKFGAEIVGVDLSLAVEAAHENNRENSNCHFVQADIYQLPFRLETFDFSYSIGVLHHLPDPYGGFENFVRYVKPGGDVWIWVYPAKEAISRWYQLLSIIRKVTTRLPFGMLYWICYLLALGERGLLHIPYRIVRKLKWDSIAQQIPMKYHVDARLRVLHTDWFDNLSVPIYNTFPKKKIEKWFKRALLCDCEFDSDWDGHACGRRPNHPV